MKSQPSTTDPYTLPVSAIANVYQVDFKAGLDPDVARARAEQFGYNVLKEVDRNNLFKRVFQELTNPLVLILVFALCLTLYMGEYVDAAVVLLAIVINISIALYQEGKAKDIFASLSKEQAKKARVIRGGHNVLIEASDLVVGDVVYVSAGELVPADIRIIDADNAEADEASLTGEWEPVKKTSSPVKLNTALADRENMIYSGTLLSSGEIKGVVVATGHNTEFGQLADEAIDSDELTPLQRQLKHLALNISILVSVLAVLIVIIGLWRDVVFNEILLIAIAIAVSAVPEGLPSAITAILAVGMRHILEKNGLVKSLLAAETLGTTDVIISDKTGTLTEGRMSLVSLIPGFYTSLPAADEVASLDEHEGVLLRSALLCSDGYLTTDREGKLEANGRPVEKALVEAGLSLGFNRDELNNDDEELDFLPFASERRFAAVLVEGVHGHYAILSGAPEYMVASAKFYYAESGKPSLMTAADRARLGDLQQGLTTRGHRLTGVARVPIEAHRFDELDQKDILATLSDKLEFLGYIGFSDPVRGDVPESIRIAQEAGARVIVATGDNRNTALSIANQAGVMTNDRVVEGRELADLTDPELYQLFREVSVFARMRPAQKKRLASVLQANGHVVAMTGDGVNDAPALASADVGVAVFSGTDVAKSAADLILLKNSFSTIVAAIKEGRRLLDNIRRVVVHRIASGFGEVLLVMSALIVAAPIPILPKQILWVNIIQGGLLTFAYAFEPAEADIMSRPPNQVGSRGIMNSQVKKLLILSSAIFGLVTLAVYLVFTLSDLRLPIEELRTIMFAVLTIDVIVFSFALKDFNRPIWKIPLFSNPVLILAVGISLGAFLATLLYGPLRDFLSLTALSSGLWLVILLVAVIEIFLIEMVKSISRQSGKSMTQVV